MLPENEIKPRSVKSRKHINENGDVPYLGFSYLSLFSVPINLATRGSHFYIV